MVVSILLAVAAATAAIVLAVRVRNQGKALGAAADRAAALETELDRSRVERAAQTVRADTAEAERTEAVAAARAASSELAVAVSSLTEATRAREALAAELDALRARHASCADAGALWALELARIDRRWHLSVAPGIGLQSPLAECTPADRPRVAIEILAVALREETGTRIAVDWEPTAALPPVTALHVVRAADELLSSSTHAAERLELAVRVTDATITVALTAFDGDDAPVAPALSTVGSFAEVPLDTITLEPGLVLVPLAEPADPADVAA